MIDVTKLVSQVHQTLGRMVGVDMERVAENWLPVFRLGDRLESGLRAHGVWIPFWFSQVRCSVDSALIRGAASQRPPPQPSLAESLDGAARAADNSVREVTDGSS